jgi:hypothetical protein
MSGALFLAVEVEVPSDALKVNFGTETFLYAIPFGYQFW